MVGSAAPAAAPAARRSIFRLDIGVRISTP